MTGKNICMEFSSYLRWTTIISCCIKLLSIPCEIIISRSISRIVESSVDGKTNTVLMLCAFLLITVIMIRVAQMILTIFYEKVKSRALHKCKMNLYQRFLAGPLNLLYASEHGKTIEKLENDFYTVTEKWVSLYPDFWMGILTAVIYFMVLAFQNMVVAGVMLAFSLIQMIPPVVVKKYLMVNYEKCREIEGQLTDFTVEGYRGFATIKLYRLKDWWLDKMAEYHKKYLKIGNASIYTATAEGTMKKAVSLILEYGVYAVVGMLILIHVTTVETGIQAIALSGGFFAAVKTVFLLIPDFSVAKVAEARLAEWFVRTCPKIVALKNEKISLANVTLAFHEKEILKNVNINFAADRICIIKGANGTGKSTILKLLVGLFPCDSGEVIVGAVNPLEFSEDVFPQKVFYLPQEDAVFDFTPYMLYQMVDEQAVPAAIHIAEEFHLSAEQINETDIRGLSGGERKKVFLSLAFALKPLLLLLDEPTNSLDEESKGKLAALLKKRKGGAIIITHDSVFDDIADCVYEMREGRVSVERKRFS